MLTVRRRLALPAEIPTARCREVGVIDRNGYSITKLVFETEAGVIVPALAFSSHESSSRNGPTVIYLHGDGKAADAGPGGAIEKLSAAGYIVLALDLRGMGETVPGKPATSGANYFGVDHKEAFLSLHLARPLLGQRVLDVLSILNASPNKSGRGYHVYSVGPVGPIALHAAAIDDRIGQITIDRPIVSWSEVVQSPLSRNQLASAVPGVLAEYDLSDLATAIAPRRIVIRDAIEGAGK